MSLGHKIAKNALLLMAATTGQKLVAFLAFTLVARLTGPGVTGAYFYAVSVTSVFVTLSDLGMTPVVIRAIAGATDDSLRLFRTAVRAKFILVPIAVLASLSYGVIMHEPTEVLAAIALACVVMAADAFHLVLYGALRGRQNLKPEALGMFIGQCLTATGAVTAAWFGLGPMGLIGALILGSLWNVGWAWWSLRLVLKVSAVANDIGYGGPAVAFGVGGESQKSKVEEGIFDFTADRRRTWDERRATIRHLAIQALPFAIAGISVKVYSYVDSLMLNAFKGPEAVGYYSVAYKLTYAMQFLPLTFTAALYPALSQAYAAKDNDGLRRTFMGSLRLMAAVAFPISAGLSALAPRLIPLLYGDKFDGSIPAMTVLPWVLLPIFMDFPIGALLNGSKRAHLKTITMVSTMLVNIVLNAFLVPAYGPQGAAWAGVISFWFLLFMGMAFTARDVGGVWPILWILARASLAAAISWVVWSRIGNMMPLFPAMILGAVIAVLCAFAVRLVTLHDLVPIWRTVVRRSGKGGESGHEK